MSWTQPICAARWNQDYGSQGKGHLISVELDENGSGDPEHCCYCGMLTRCGIYVRIDPSTVPYPRE